MRTRAADGDHAFDTSYLSTFLNYDASNIQTLAVAPTVDLVVSFLAAVTQKAEEFENLKTDKLKVDVEFNDAVHAAEKKTTIQRTTVARQSKEIESLRAELAETTAAKETLANQLGASKGAATDSHGEVETLKARVESLESSKRDALSLLDSKTADKDRLHEEFNEQHGKLVALRRQCSELEQKASSLDNLTSQQKFKESALQQELDLLRKNNEWQAGELKTSSQEHAKFRKERNQTISKLQRDLEDATATCEALKASETTLRHRLTELEAKLNEAYEKHAEAREEHLRSAQSLREQVDTSKRLADLQAQQAGVHKAQVQSLQAQLDELRDHAAQEIGQLHNEIDAERAEKEQVERRLAEIEIQRERAEQEPPSTPLANGSPRTLETMKGTRALTQTQLYGQYVETKENLAREERRCAKLQSALDDLIQDMEAKAPELVEMRQEQERLESEVLSFSRLLDEANSVRDDATREATKWQHEAVAAGQEGELLRQQLRDVSAQVKILLVELQSQEQGLGEMTVQERLDLERAARGDTGPLAIEGVSSTQSLISERLVIFRSVAELQQQNEQLLRLTRELGEKMEGEEAQEKARQSAAQVTESDELRAQVERYKDELQATATQIDSYMKERDMFRRMLQHRGTLGPNTDVQAMFGSSIPPATPQRNGDASTPRTKELDELNKLLKEQQLFFDQFRQETANDRTLLKDQIDNLIRERSSLQADSGRLESQLALASQRYELLQSNFNSTRGENTALQQRLQSLVESAAKQDLRSQQLVDELMEARSLAEAFRNDSATTKAEKDLWKRIEGRLTEDNGALLDERTRLSKLVTDLQSLANERELSDSEGRRRVQARSEQLETELSELKRKFDNEVEQGKKSSMRKEYEDSQNRTRVDDLVKSLSTAREDLAAARSARDQLQVRVDEMRIDLRAAQDKVATLQLPRMTLAVTDGGQADTQVNGSADLTIEQRLNLQISDIRRELERATNELAGAREQIEQYKTIAQQTEEELQNFNQTSDQYRTEADKQLAEKDANLQRLEQQIQDLGAELATTNAELSNLRTRHDEASKTVDSERQVAEAELARLRDDQDRHLQEKTLYQEDLKAQAEIAQQAQQSYETELLKHADAARQLQAVRQERDSLRDKVTVVQKNAQVSARNLASAEESWSEQKDRLESEIQDLQRRKSDGDSQLKLLHQQMESFSTELQTLRQGRVAEANVDTNNGDAEGRLQEVITYLRREKDIIEVQHEFTVSDNKRLQQQLNHAQSQLDEVQQKLAEERKQHNDRANNEASTTRLAQAIDELNLFRESAVTLRNEARQAKERLDSRSKDVERMQAEIYPLRVKLGELEADIEAKDDEIKLITQDRDHWRDRTQSIISKYDRVDPAELDELKKKLADLTTERQEALGELEMLRATSQALSTKAEQYDQLLREHQTVESANRTLQTQLTEQVEQAEASQTLTSQRLEKFKEQAKEQNRTQKARIAETKAELDTAQADVLRLQQELNSFKQQHDASSSDATRTASDQVEITTQLARANQTAAEQTERAAQLQTRIAELETQLASLSTEIEQLKAASASAAAAEPEKEQGEITETSESSSQLQNVQQQLVEAQKQIEQLQSQAAAQSTQQQTNQPGNSDGQLPDLTDEQVNQLIKTNARVKTIVGNSVKKNVSKETERLSKALSDKEEEIAKLKESSQSLVSGDGQAASDASQAAIQAEKDKADLLKRLAEAQQEKEAAVKQATDTAEMKAKVQLSQRDLAQAKLNVVSKAAQTTPARAVSEVWEEAKVARPTRSAPSSAPKADAAATKATPADASATANKPVSGIPLPSTARGSDIPRGAGGMNIRGRGGAAAAAAGIKRPSEGSLGNNNKRTKG